MPVHIQKLETSATVATGDFPLSEAQQEEIVQMVIRRLHELKRDQKRSHAATVLRSSAIADDMEAGGAEWD